MNLRKQLLLVSLLTLILPWAGCQFIRETESALRQGQEQMLAGTARAIADSFSQFHHELLAYSDESDASIDRLYAHPLQRPPLIDGYVDDWTIPNDALQTLRGSDGPIRYVLGVSGQHWYVFVDVRDNNVVYAPASGISSGSINSDGITFLSFSDSGERTEFSFSAEAPGQLVAVRKVANQTFYETRILAHWQDTSSGYRLEARIPKNLLSSKLGITVVNTGDTAAAGIASKTFSGALPGALVSISPVLQSVAGSYAQDGMRLIVTDPDGWRIAQAGTVSMPLGTGSGRSSGWLRMTYDLLLEPGADTALAEPAPSGREQQGYINEALVGDYGTTRWFRSSSTGRAVVSVAEPIWSGNVRTGAVVLQKGTDEIFSLTNKVLTRLVILTLTATIVVAIVLLGYASWLSLRIRRLSFAAESALDNRALQSALPSALSGDEVGDLSRSFSSVLKQLGTYNDYLQSLAGKLSHELRTPLTIVRSSLENLEHEDLSADALQYTARAREGTDRLGKILAAMSEANRTEELIESAELETFDLNNLLTSTVAAYASAWPERNFDYTARVSSTQYFGAPELIIQMLDKLVDNAVEFTETGDTIDVTLAGNASVFEIAVSNPGPQLPEEMHARLFDSMISVRSGEPGKHLGLGLYIARLIAEGHGGSIDAANTDNGVIFHVRLPVNKSA